MAAFAPESLILYVDDVEASTDFYRSVLDREPVARFEGFSVFTLGAGFSLGLQSRHSIDPEPQAAVGGFELCLSDTDRETVDALHRQWVAQGVPIVLAPTDLDFGYTFVATDPDGHRLRVCATRTDIPELEN